MTPEQTALARKLVEHPRWEWVPGLRVVYLDDAGPDPARVKADDEWGDGLLDPSDTSGVPDLTDAATGGVLLSMIPPVGAVIRRENEVLIALPPTLYRGTTLAEACAEALLARWRDRDAK